MNELELFKDNEWTLFIIFMAALGVNSEFFETYLEEEKRRKADLRRMAQDILDGTYKDKNGKKKIEKCNGVGKTHRQQIIE